MTGDAQAARVAGPAASSARCGECSERMPDGAKFCPSCGAAYGLSEARSTAMVVRLGVGSGFRFGLGFFLATALFGAISFLVSVLLVGGLIAALIAGVSGASTSGSSTFQGVGTAKSEPIQLAGNVDLTWTAAPPPDQGCWHRAAVTSADTTTNTEVVVDQQVDKSISGTYVLRGLPAATYIIDVGSTC